MLHKSFLLGDMRDYDHSSFELLREKEATWMVIAKESRVAKSIL
jgi:hypothetical protein